MATSRPPQPTKPLDLDLTIVSAKHLKNVNWRHGDLSPYAIFFVDPDRRLSTKSDDSGSTRPVWNERFLIPLALAPTDSVLTIELFHSKPLDTPKPLIGTLRFPLKDLVDSDEPNKLRTFDLRRPSGRPQGKIRLKISLRERPVPDYQVAPPPNYYYSSAPLPQPSVSRSEYRSYAAPPPPSPAPSPYVSSHLPPPPPQSYPYGSYSDPYSGYYPGYYSQPPPPPRPFFDRQSSYGTGPSAPVDYAKYEQKSMSGKMGLGTGLAVGALAGAVGGIALEEGLKYEEEKIADRVENDLNTRDDYSDYRVEY